MSSLRTLSFLLTAGFLAALAGCQAVHRAPQPPSRLTAQASSALEALEDGQISDLDLVKGTAWETGVSVSTESYLQLVVEQRNLDVHVQVLDHDSEPVAAVDGSGGIGVVERLALRLAPGEYWLVLTPRTDGPAKGRVRLHVEALRPVDPLDSERLRLVLLGQEATQLDGGSAQQGWKRAVQLSIEELDGWRALGDSKAVIRTLIRLVSLERALGEHASSIRHGEEALNLSLEADLDAEEAATRYWLAQTLNRAGDVSAANSQLELGLAAAERADDLLLQGRILIWQGRLREDRGDLEGAQKLYQRALTLRRKAHDTRGINSAINNLAVIAQKMGDFPLALELYRKAIAEARQLGNPGAAILNNSNLSSLMVARGQWQEALDELSAGLELARATDDQPNESILGSKLAQLLLTLGEHEPARRLLLRSLELDEARLNGADQANVLMVLARLDLRLGNLAEAETWMLRAHGLSTRLELSARRDQAARGLAALRLQQESPALALEILRPLVDEARSSNQPTRLARALQGLAEAYLSVGSPAEALRQLELADEALTGLPIPEIRFDISYLTARAKHAQGDLSGAVGEIERALEMLERLRLAVDDPDLRATFLSHGREAYAFAVSRLLELDRVLPGQGFDRRAFATLERARARSLVEILSTARFGAEPRVDAALLEAERTALAAVARARGRLDQATAEERRQDLRLLQSELDAARELLTRAEEALRRAEPRYASLRYADNYAVEELQSQLEPGVALVEYSLQPGHSVAFIISRERFDVVELAAEEIIAQQAAGLRETLTSPKRRAYGKLLTRARDLGDLVIAPLSTALGDAHRLIVVPDGALAFIPFEALRLGEAESSKEVFLIEKWATSYSPSAGVLRSLAQERRPSSRRAGLVAFADPEPPTLLGEATAGAPWPRLPGARREVAAIAASLDAPGTAIYVDAHASEQAMKWDPAVGLARWIHLASHARIDQRTPAESAIVLSPSDGEDGYLTVQEIFALALQAELVVLSGCETALGRQIRGEGLIGLTRAFLYAGARGIQVSLWKVSDDTTPALMASFYANLAQNLGAPEALQAAKLESLADPRRSHPFYWAPFVLIGS